MRMRRKKNLGARMERVAHLLVSDPCECPSRWRGIFNMPGAPLYLELGCGKGAFTAETARQCPGAALVALERSPDALVVAMERASGLSNIRFIRADASQLASFFAEGEVSRLYINFCDPWPGNRHAKRRLTSRGFLEDYRRILAPGGELLFKTDNEPLFDFSVRELKGAGFSFSDVTKNLHENGPVGVMTDYEAKFHESGVRICSLRAAVPLQ